MNRRYQAQVGLLLDVLSIIGFDVRRTGLEPALFSQRKKSACGSLEAGQFGYNG